MTSNKQYLITSCYSYYDDFDFQNVCICSTKERAEELVKEFNKNKEDFISLKGKILYINKEKSEQPEDFEDLSVFERNYFEGESNIGIPDAIGGVSVFLSKEDYKEYQKKIKDSGIYVQDSTFFGFLSQLNKETLTRKYCNDSEAVISIEEIELID